MLSGRQRGGHILKGGMHAAHDLGHRLHGGIAGDLPDGADLEIRVLLSGAHKNGAGLKALRVLQHLINTVAHRSESENCNFHNYLLEVSLF